MGRPELPISRSELPVLTHDPRQLKPDASPKNEDELSPFGRAMKGLKKFKRSKLISVLLKGRHNSQLVGRIILSKLI